MTAVSPASMKIRMSGLRKQKHAERNEQAEAHGNDKGGANAFLNALCLPGAVVLRGKNGERIAKVLHGKIGEGVNFDSGGKGSHNGGAKTIDQTLHRKNAQIHNRLLQAGERGKAGNLFDAA